MKTLSTAHATAVASTITNPGYLVRIDFSTPQRLSTLATTSWDGESWTAYDVKVEGIGQDSKGQTSAKITLGNNDLYWSAYILNEGVADRRIRIWAFDGSATALADVEPVFDGVGNVAEIRDSDVTITCVAELSKATMSPRRFIGPQTGFNHLSPDQKKMTIGGVTVTLERNK